MRPLRPLCLDPDRKLMSVVSQNHFSSLLMVGDGQVKMKAWTRIGVLINQVRLSLALLVNPFRS